MYAIVIFVLLYIESHAQTFNLICHITRVWAPFKGKYKHHYRGTKKEILLVLCPKCSPSNTRRNETNGQHSFLVKWLIRLPGKQEVHGSIPCERRISFFCSVLWSYHHVAISVIRVES